jgi:hypothetical protein
MTERVDIANLALTWWGEGIITSLEDESDAAIIMSVNYIPARDATLEAHDWSFAIMRFIPPKNAVAPVYGASAAFDIPTNILRVISVDDPKTANFSTGVYTPVINSKEQLDWVFENRQVICNEEVIHCRGIRRVEQEGLFSPNFVQAFAAKLAFLSAMSLTSSASIQANMKEFYDEFILVAKSRDGLQGRSKRLRNRDLLKSR